MNEQLIKFIELCLADGVISDKEREVIFRKAKALGVDEDECEILIDSFTQRINKVSSNDIQTPSKNKRNFTPKKVSNLKPATLNQEKELLLKVSENNSKLNMLKAEYNGLVQDITTVKNKLDFLKQLNEADFNSYIKEYKEDKNIFANLFLKTVEDDVVSKNKGYHVVMRFSRADKIKLREIILDDTNTVVDFISTKVRWNIYPTKKTNRKNIILGIIFMVVPLIFFFAFNFDSIFSTAIEILVFIVGIVLFLGGVIELKPNNNAKNAKSVLNRCENNVILYEPYKISFTGILKKNYKKQIDELLERREIIKKVEGLHNTAINIPQRKK